MKRQVSTITPADTGTMMLPGAAAGALGFTAANIGKQLLASKFKGYGHLATSSLASAGFGALVGGLGGSFINKKPRSTPMQASYNNGMNNNNYIDKQAGIISRAKRFTSILSGKKLQSATNSVKGADTARRAAEAQLNKLPYDLREGSLEAKNYATKKKLWMKRVQHANNIRQLTHDTRVHTGIIGAAGLGAAGTAYGLSRRGTQEQPEKTASQVYPELAMETLEKQAGIVSGVKGFARDLLGTDVKRYTRRADLINRVAERIAKTDPYNLKRLTRLGHTAARNDIILDLAAARMGKARRIAGNSAGISLGVGAGYALGSRKREKTANMNYSNLALKALEKQAGWTSFKHGLNMMKDSVFKDKSWKAFKGSAKFTGTQIKNDIGDVVQKYKPKFLKNTSSVSETANTAASTIPNKSFIQRHPVGTAAGALGAGYLAGHMLAPQPQNNQPEKVAGVGNILAAYARKNPIETAFLGAGALGMGANAYAKRNGIPVEFSSETNPHSANFKSNLKQYFKHGLSGDALRLTGKFIKKEHPILGAISNNAGRALQGLATVDATKGLYNAYKAVKYKPREKKASTESEELKRVATALGGLDEESRMIRSWGYENAKPWLKANKWKIGLGAGALAGGIYGAHKLRQKYNENYAPENIGETHLIRNGLIGAGLTGAGNFLRYAAGSPGATKPGVVGKVYLAGAAANALGGALLGKTVYDGYKKFSNPIPRNRD